MRRNRQHGFILRHTGHGGIQSRAGRQAQAEHGSHPARRRGRAHGRRAEHLGGGLLHRLAVHRGLVVGECAEQGAVAQQVDASRHAAGQVVDALQRLALERHRAAQARHFEPVLHVLRRFHRRERAQVVAGDHPLRELFQVLAREHGAQLGLADQDDLQQLALARLEVGEQAQLLQHVGRQVLRLVDDEHVVAPGGVGAQQEVVQRIEVVLHRGRLLVAARHGDVELVADRLQQLDHRELGIEDVGDVAVGRDLLQEQAAHRGLAGADLARQQHEAAPAAQPIEQVGQRLPVALAHEQVARVRRDGERLALQPEIWRIHGRKDNAPV